MCKTIIAAGLVVALVLSFAGCRADSSGETSLPSGTENTTTAAPSTSTDKEEEDLFRETVLVDNKDLLFKITAVENDPVWGYTLKAQIENRTDKDLMFSLNDVSVNGYMCDPYFAATVTAGMKANKDISFSTDSFEESGIQAVTDIEFELRVYNSNNLAADEVLEEDFVIYPMGKDAAREYPRERQEGDIVLFDNDNCTMIITGFDPDSIWGYSANVYLVNKTDDTLMFSVGDAAVNGFMCDPYFATSVAPGKQCITAISWTKADLEENDITEVESIRLPIRVYDADDWTDDDLVNESFTVNP